MFERALVFARTIGAVALAGLGVASIPCLADDCTPMDMRQSGGPMEGIQPMSQGEHGICYAYAAAQLADSWTCAHLNPRNAEALRTMHRTSPIALAADTRAAGFDSTKQGQSNCGATMSCAGMSPLNGGWANDCIKYLRSKPNAACDHRQAFGESTITYKHFSSHLSEYEIIPGVPSWDEDETTITKTGLGMGGTFAAGKHIGGREFDVSFAGRDSDYLKAVMKAYDDYQDRLRNPVAGIDAADAMSLQLTCALRAAGLPDELLVGRLVGNVNPVLSSLFRQSGGGTKLAFLKQYFDSACSGKSFGFSPQMPELHQEQFYPEKGNHDPDKIVSYINSRLGMPGALPVEIGYCASILYGSDKFTGLNPTGPVEVKNKDGSTDSTRCLRKAGTDSTGNTLPAGQKETKTVGQKGMVGDPSDHSSLIVGRKRGPNGACMFLVRNSWGASCERYLSKESGYQCEESTGDIWIDASKLASAIQDVSHFTP